MLSPHVSIGNPFGPLDIDMKPKKLSITPPLTDLSANLNIVFLAIVGSLLLYAGRRRRVGDAPHCLNCNYLLHGLSSERCPECGSELSSAVIVHGEPRRRWKSFIAGWLVLLLAGILVFTGG